MRVLGSRDDRGSRAPVLRAAACVAFTVGALTGGIATFIGLSALGGAVAVGPAVAVAVAISLAAAAAEACGVRIVPQVRRQVPESWRRRLPLPAAAGAYGVLLGLGFVTFVLTLAFWALAVVALVLGQVRLGLALGAGFGLGRAVPILLLAPLASQASGRDILDAMSMRPRMLRGLRALAGAALGACAAVLLAHGASAASTPINGTDPSAEFGVVAWDRPAGSILRYKVRALGGAAAAHHTGPLEAPLPGRDAAVGEGLVAWRSDRLVRVVRRSDFEPVLQAVVPGANELAVSSRWLVYRVTGPSSDRLVARSLSTGRERTIASTGAGQRLGRPSVRGDLVVFHVASTQESRIVAVDLAHGTRRVLRASRIEQLTNPSVDGGSLVYVRASATAQELVRGPLDQPAGDRTLLRAPPTALRDLGYEPGYSHHTRTPRPGRSKTLFWTTALAPRSAYLTLDPLTQASASARFVSLPVGRSPAPRPLPNRIAFSPPTAPPVLVYTASNRSQDVLVAVTALAHGRGGRACLAPRGSGLVGGRRETCVRRTRRAVRPALDGLPPVRITRGGADADPSWSPTGTIAFVRGRAIYTVGEDGSGLRRVTSPRPALPGACVVAGRNSPRVRVAPGRQLGHLRRRHSRAQTSNHANTGRRGISVVVAGRHDLAFERQTNNGWRIFVDSWDGGTATRLTSGPGDDVHSAWAPDGAFLAFVGDQSTGSAPHLARRRRRRSAGSYRSYSRDRRCGGLAPN